MNFDVVDIKLLRDHSTELAQFGPTPLDLSIAPNMEVTDDQMVAAHLDVPQELKHAVGRDNIKEEAWVLRNVSVQNDFNVIRLHTRSLRKLLIASSPGTGERQGLTDLRIVGMLALIEEVEALGGMTRAVNDGLPKPQWSLKAARMASEISPTVARAASTAAPSRLPSPVFATSVIVASAFSTTVAGASSLRDPFNLRCAHCGIVDVENLDFVFVLQPIAINANDHFFTTVDRCLSLGAADFDQSGAGRSACQIHQEILGSSQR